MLTQENQLPVIPKKYGKHATTNNCQLVLLCLPTFPSNEEKLKIKNIRHYSTGNFSVKAFHKLFHLQSVDVAVAVAVVCGIWRGKPNMFRGWQLVFVVVGVALSSSTFMANCSNHSISLCVIEMFIHWLISWSKLWTSVWFRFIHKIQCLTGQI